MTVTIADIKAAGDVIDQLTAEINLLDAPSAIRQSEALGALKAKIDLAMSLLKTRTLTAMDGQPVQVDATVYIAKPSGKWRPSWAKLRTVVFKAALVNDDGEVLSASEACSRAIDIMQDLYVSPSTVPKKGAMDRLRIDLADVATYERGVPELRKVEVGEGPE